MVLYLIPSGTGAAGTTVRWLNGSTITVTAAAAVPTPTTTSISPSSATAGGAGFALTVNGTNFISGTSTVTWNGSNRSTTFVNATQLTATIPNTDIASPGTANVGVTNTGAPSASNTQTFTINAPATPLLAITGTPTDHGTVCPTVSATPVQYTITNSGAAQADGLTVISNDPQFVVSGLSNTSVAASGGTVTYNVTFTPSSAGAKSATITVSSTTGGSNSPTSGLTGTGTTPVTQTVSSAAASAINNTIATLNGNVTALGVCPSTTQKGFVYSLTATNADPLNGGTGVTTTPVAGVATGAYTLPLSSLTPGTGYSFKAYVYNGTTYTYGALTTFTTLQVANHLEFVGVPPSGNINTAISTFTVEARRADNSVDTNYTGNVTISKASGPGTLSGTLTVAAVAGVASFSTAQFDAIGTYTLSVASGALTPATSGNITINLAPVALGVYTFTGTACSAGALAASSVVSNVSFTNASVTGETCNNNSGTSYSVGGTSWGTAFSATRYVQVAITPATGSYLDLSSITFDHLRSAAGAQNATVRSSVDGYAADLTAPFSVGTSSANKSVTLGGIPFSNLTGTVTFRIYGWGGSNTGDLRLDNITVNGNVTCINPQLFTVTGGGTACSTASGVAVGLSGSQSIMTYQLKRNGSDVGSPVAGTGSALNFGNQTVSGNYTVEAHNSNGTCNVVLAMTGSASVTIDAAPVGGTLGGSATVCVGGNSGTLTLTGHSGTIVKWQSSTTSDFSANVTDIAVTVDNYNYTNVAQNTYYRVELSNGVCSPVYSSVALLTVQQNSWTGAIDSDWNTAGNWSCNAVPGFAQDITITDVTNNPVISSDVTINSLTLAAGAALTVETGYDLTVTDAISIDATASMTIEVDANVIQVNDVDNSGVAIVQRNSASLMRLDYTLWSSPVADQNLLDFSPNTVTTRFYVYNPGTDLYNSVTPSTTDFAEGTGYLIRMPDNHPTTPTVWGGEFTGEMNNGDVDITVTNNTYNAVGNPYPSTISADAFITGNSLTEALYFWRKTNNAATTSYATYTLAGGAGTSANAGDPLNLTPNGTIQVGQGFIARSTSGTLSFNNGMRTGNNAGQFLRTAEVERNRLWVNLTNTEGVFSQTMVSYMTGATQGVDAAIDGLYFNDSQVALTSLIDATEYAVQGRALPFTTADVVPMGFKVLTAGTYTIGLDHVDGLFENPAQEIILKDNLNNTEHDLRAGNYTFASEAGVFNGRFEIVYHTTLGLSNPVWNANQVVVFKQGQDLIVNSGNVNMAAVKVYDLRGRLLAEKQNINGIETKLFVGTSNQVLLVKVISSDNKEVTKKVMN
ncbi:T9SS sorting signal type C domain-containing protein [Flavobacterium sp.]|uniref:T9SS sorting signal type C domain-containing protein n=1 Tax=Flavobacterium sp. TaxID=239 RepID=UPI0039E675C1